MTAKQTMLALLSALMCLAAAPAALAASELSAFEASHAAAVYDSANGMPFSEANCVAQIPDGLIYIGSYGGLIEYDGREFRTVEGVSSGVTLYVDQRARLWVGTNEMGAVCIERGEVVRVLGAADGLPSLSVRGFAEDETGGMVIATRAGAVYLDGSDNLRAVEDETLAHESFYMLSGDGHGNLYATTADGDALLIRGRTVARYWDAERFGVDVSCVTPDPLCNGWVYFGTESGELLHGSADDGLDGFETIPLADLHGVNHVYCGEGSVWVCADNGAGYLDDGGFHRLEHMPVKGALEQMTEDYEGNLWFASSRRGVMKLSVSRFADLSGMAELGKRVVNATWQSDGLLYIGTDSGLIVLDEGWNVVRTAADALLGSERIRSIVGDSSGALWFCTYGEKGLVRYVPRTGELRCYTQEDGLASDYVRDAIELSDGSLLVSALGGVHRFRCDRLVRTYDGRDGLPSTSILSMCEAEDGSVCLGSDGDGVYVLDHNSISHLEDGGALGNGVVLRIARDSRRSCLWLVTGSGELACLRDGRVTRMERLSDAVRSGGPWFDILLDDNGGLWMLGGSGICVLSGDALLSGDESACIFYNRRDGLPHVATSNSRSYVSPEGVAYLAGSDGVTMTDLNAPTQGNAAPMLRVRGVDVDDETIWLTEGGHLDIPARTKHLSIHALAITYALGEAKVAYRLEGFDSEGTELDASELGMVSYTNLPGGSYTFRVTAEDSESAFVTITKKKKLTEHPAFWAAPGLLAALAFFAVTRRALLRQKKLLERKREEARLDSELNMAATIQSDMLPSDFPAFPNRSEFDVYATMHPAKEVGGDFYDFFLVDDDHLALVVADVSGKGVPAALFMMIAKTLLKSATLSRLSPARVMNEVNAKLCENNREMMFVTVWLGILEISTGTLTFADAGHENPLLLHDGKWSFVAKHNGVALALMEPELLELEDDPVFVDETLYLEPGDVLFQYTDGVIEATNAQNELFGEERLLDAMNRAPTRAPTELLPWLHSELHAFVKEAPQFDDITMLALRLKKTGAEHDNEEPTHQA